MVCHAVDEIRGRFLHGEKRRSSFVRAGFINWRTMRDRLSSSCVAGSKRVRSTRACENFSRKGNSVSESSSGNPNRSLKGVENPCLRSLVRHQRKHRRKRRTLLLVVLVQYFHHVGQQAQRHVRSGGTLMLEKQVEQGLTSADADAEKQVGMNLPQTGLHEGTGLEGNVDQSVFSTTSGGRWLLKNVHLSGGKNRFKPTCSAPVGGALPKSLPKWEWGPDTRKYFLRSSAA
jgi:hypothetical protein